MPFFVLIRALSRAAGPAALLRVAPPFAVIGIVSTVLFAGYGMRASDLVALMAASRGARLSLWAAWLLVTAPAARALLIAPSTFGLRALPVPTWWFLLVHGAHLFALQAPWILLFARGAGALAALAAGAGAAASAALLVARPRTLAEVASAGAMASAVVLGAPALLLLPLGLYAGSIGIAAAFARAPERDAPSASAWIARSAPLALTLAHAAVLRRRDAVTLLRGAAAALVGAMIAVLAIHNNGARAREEQETIALAVACLPLGLAAGGVAVKVLETERRLEWLLLAAAASTRLRAGAAAFVSAAWGAIAGALYGVTAALAVPGDLDGRLRLALLGVVMGASLGGVAAHFARRAERATGVDGTVVVVGVGAAAILAAALSSWLGVLAVAPVGAMALALATSTARLLRRRERVAEHVTRAALEDA